MKPDAARLPKTTRIPHRGMRTCAACRRRFAPDRLVRFFLLDDALGIRLPGTKSTGRGFSLCPAFSCFEKAGKSPQLTREFGVGRFSGRELMMQARQAYRNRSMVLGRSGGDIALQRLEFVFQQLSSELLNLPSCGSGETHVR